MVLRALAIVLLIAACPPAFAQQGQCEAAAFREAVAQASATITVLHEKNGRIFQENLQKLRAVNHWREADYVANATPFVRDEATASFDAENQALLAKVQSLDAAGAATEFGALRHADRVEGNHGKGRGKHLGQVGAYARQGQSRFAAADPGRLRAITLATAQFNGMLRLP